MINFMTTLLKYLAVIPFLLLIISCEKEEYTGNRILGTWISTDKADTLKIFDEDSFKKSNHTFLYSRNIENITIQYSGPYYILVSPSTHHYTLGNYKLTIDFTNGCYGFDAEIITFIKQ
jgi:hypothetical protein